MGNVLASIKDHYVSEFERVQALAGSKRDWITLDSVLSIEPAPEWGFPLQHAGMLYCINTSRDGRFSLPQILGFVDRCAELGRPGAALETRVRAHSTLVLWRAVIYDEAATLTWFCTLLEENYSVVTLPGFPNERYTPVDTVTTLHRLLDVSSLYSVDLQEFIDVLQRVAEEQGRMDVTQEQQDDLVPISVLRTFLAEFLRGVTSMMNAFGFDRESAAATSRSNPDALPGHV